MKKNLVLLSLLLSSQFIKSAEQKPTSYNGFIMVNTKITPLGQLQKILENPAPDVSQDFLKVLGQYGDFLNLNNIIALIESSLIRVTQEDYTKINGALVLLKKSKEQSAIDESSLTDSLREDEPTTTTTAPAQLTARQLNDLKDALLN